MEAFLFPGLRRPGKRIASIGGGKKNLVLNYSKSKYTYLINHSVSKYIYSSRLFSISKHIREFFRKFPLTSLCCLFLLSMPLLFHIDLCRLEFLMSARHTMKTLFFFYKLAADSFAERETLNIGNKHELGFYFFLRNLLVL